MFKVHNLDYYNGAVDRAVDFYKNHQNQNRFKSYLRPDNFIINKISQLLTKHLFTQAIKLSYAFSGTCLVKATCIFSTHYAAKLDEFRHDPIDTKILLTFCNFAQATSLKYSLRKPIKFPIIREPDKCLISIARHIYVISKDMSLLLSIPGKIRSYLEWGVGNPTTLLGRIWEWVKYGIQLPFNALTQAIQKSVQAARVPLAYVPLVNASISYLGKKIEKVRTYFQLNLIKRAHQVLDNQERFFRRKVVAKVAEVGCHQLIGFTTNLALRTLIGWTIYGYAKQAIADYTGSHEISDQIGNLATWSLTALGGYFWVRSISSTLYGLHRSYKEDFDPEASTLMELRTLINRRNLYKVVEFVKYHWKKQPGG